jgi:predicted pyridoxine 5'-phosphate oxidase superfamily flavin-nucleotide-binding protein
MTDTPAPASDVVFSDAVKRVQERKGSRAMIGRRDFGTLITPDLKAFIEMQVSIYLATASADGQPYIQHRGGPEGFLHVLDERTIAFADFAGNRQYVTLGNLSENAKAQLFLMDYMQRQRIKIWGTARIVDDDPELLARLMPQGYRARAEQALVFTVTAWDVNCQQHIPQRFEAADVAAAIGKREERIAALEAELARLKSAAEDP